MGGRIYDPTLGRFLQADPFIQAPKNSQNYNRYSYVLNNPMSMTDPTEYFFSKLWEATTGKVLRAIASVPLINTAINVGLNFVPGCQVWCSAAFSAATTYAVTGSLKASLTAGAITAATAYAFSEIGAYFDGLDGVNGGSYNFGGNMLTGGEVAQQIFAHAIVGGISAELQGGKFGHGFFSAGVTKGIGGTFLPSGDDLTSGQIAQGALVSAVIGGTTSKISGGKFANDAQTGAFQHLFNQVAISYETIFDKDIVTLDKTKLTLSAEIPGLELISIDSDGNSNGPALSGNGQSLGVDGRVSLSAPLGLLSLTISDGDVVVSVKGFTHGLGGGCAAIQSAVGPPMLNPINNNVQTATLPQQNVVTGNLFLDWKNMLGVPNNVSVND